MEKKLNFKKYKKKICFDLDGVLCKTYKNFYKNSIPIKSNIKKINYLFDQGNYIFIYTSRYMGRNNDNKLKAKKIGYKFTKTQLNSWGVKFHKLIMGKPSYDIIIDDKSIDYKKNWKIKI